MGMKGQHELRYIPSLGLGRRLAKPSLQAIEMAACSFGSSTCTTLTPLVRHLGMNARSPPQLSASPSALAS